MLRSMPPRLCALLLGLGAASSAGAQLTVDRSVLEFDPGRRTQDVEIRNDGDFKIYVDLGVAEIVDPHLDDGRRVELDDPRTSPVLVSPEQVLVEPGQRRRVRVIVREPATDRDRIFRLSVKPFAGKVQLGRRPAGETSSGIKVLVGYDLLLLSRPAELDPEVRVERTEEAMTFVNTGNTNVLLRRVAQCDRDGGDCTELQPNRLYAGERLELELPKRGPAEDYPVEVLQTVKLRSSRSVY